MGKNRPKKKPVGLYVMIALMAALPAFTLGILAGWFLFRTDPAVFNKMVAEQVEKELAKAAPPPGAQPGAVDPAGAAPEPALTFYETLPKGGKSALGSGLNPVLPGGHPAASAPPGVDVKSPAMTPAATREANMAPASAKPAATAPTSSHPAPRAATPVPAASAPPKESKAPPAAAKKPATRGTYSVQTASYQDKREAEEVRNRLMGKGHSAYIVVTEVPGKGTWYRIRIGRHLDEAAAKELAGKLGKGTMVVPE